MGDALTRGEKGSIMSYLFFGDSPMPTPTKSSTREILLGGRRVRYVLERKRVKNINLRIRPDGSVHVSCPPLVPLGRVEAFLKSEERRILSALDRAQRSKEKHPEPLLCADGERLCVWGSVVTLRIRRGRGAELREGELRLGVLDTEDAGQRRRALERWQRASCEERLTAICRELYPAFAARGVPWPELRFRRMTSRWGVCRPQSGTVTFNVRLCELPERCARYVAAHEFTHFLQPNHSAAFYAELARVLPDWAERRALLRQWE